MKAPGASYDGCCRWLRVTALLMAAGVVAWANAATARDAPDEDAERSPEIASGYVAKTELLARRQAMATAHPLASAAGLEMLRAGGSAVDAAIAAQLVLGLVEPQSSGIGGGAFLVVGEGAQVRTYDGRETAPAAAREDLFLQNGQPMAFFDAVVGGRAVGVPGVLRLLALAHARHGRLPWARLFAPAIRLAEQGFPLGARLHTLLAADPYLRRDAAARAYFYRADGQPHPIGFRLRNPALAALYRRIAHEGVHAFYEGAVARDIVRAVRTHAGNPGVLSEDDLAHYRAVERAPLCVEQALRAQVYRLCGMAPPSSGTLALGQILGMMSSATPAHDVTLGGAAPSLRPDWSGAQPNADWLHVYSEASRLAFADRARYVADPAFLPDTQALWPALLAPDYLAARAALIGPTRLPQAPAGQPTAAHDWPYASAASQPEHGTTQLSIADARGQTVAMTSSIENAFGARLMVQGFLLNNQLTDFSFAPTDAQGRPVANRVQPGKRPRSTMTPLLVFARGSDAPLLILGSAGGPTIVHHVAKTVWAVLHEGLTLQQALDAPNFAQTGGPLWLESGGFAPTLVERLRARGDAVREAPMTSGVQALQRIAKEDASVQGAPMWRAASDPRREGVALGD